MERRQFLAFSSGVAAAVASAGAAMAASPAANTTPLPGYSPLPGSSPYSPRPIYPHPHRPRSAPGNTSLERIHRRLERLIEMLHGEQADYGGHRSAAINYLQQADGEIVAGMSSSQNGSQNL